MRLPVLAPSTDIHTSDLTEGCARKVRLKWDGKIKGDAPTAMVRGLIAGKACDIMLTRGLSAKDASLNAAVEVRTDLQNKNIVLTDAAMRDIDEIYELVGTALERMPDLLAEIGAGSLIGVELPVRGKIDVDGVPQNVASHIDMLWRRDDGTKVIVDWKWREDNATRAYLSRNQQLALYWFLAHNKGMAQLPDGTWRVFSGETRIAWIHLPGLLPVKRRTTITDYRTGEVIELAKGDPRPVSSVVRWISYDHRQMQTAIDEIGQRISMYRAGLYPMTPDPVGCHLCECEPFCPRFDVPDTQWSQG